jgi:hypothetical protein
MNEWAIQLKQSDFGEHLCLLSGKVKLIARLGLGDPGILITDAEDDCIYGALASEDLLSGIGSINPAISIQNDLQRILRADLHHGQEVRHL